MMFVSAMFSKFDTGDTLIWGLVGGSLFLFASLFYGVFFDHTWGYILQAFFAVTGFTVLWILLIVASDKFGTPIKNGEGMIVMLAPMMIFPVLFGVAIVVKFVFDFILQLFR